MEHSHKWIIVIIGFFIFLGLLTNQGRGTRNSNSINNISEVEIIFLKRDIKNLKEKANNHTHDGMFGKPISQDN